MNKHKQVTKHIEDKEEYIKFNLGRLLGELHRIVINEILAEFRSDDGFALPSRYEVVLLPPQVSKGKPKGALNNVFSIVMQENTGEGTQERQDYNVSQ